MKVFQGLSLFLGLIVLGYGGDSAPKIDPAAEKKLSERIEIHRNVVKAYASGHWKLTESEDKILKIRMTELEKIYNEMNEEFASYWELSSVPCIYARDHHKKISKMLEKLGDTIAANDTLYLILKGVIRKSMDMCLHENYSPRNYFYDFYNLTLLTEWKGYTMLTKFHDLLNSRKAPECFDGNENETEQDKNYIPSHENRLVTYNNMFKPIMESIKCIPEFYACDEYHDFRKDLGVFKSPSDLNEDIRRLTLLKKWAGRRFFYSLVEQLYGYMD